MTKEETQQLLKKWANWRLYGNSYSSQSSIQAFREGGIGGVFESKPPPGVQMPEGVGYISRAMQCAMGTRLGNGKYREIRVVQGYYLTRQAGFSVQEFCDDTGLSRNTVNKMRSDGEFLIMGYIAGFKEQERLRGESA